MKYLWLQKNKNSFLRYDIIISELEISMKWLIIWNCTVRYGTFLWLMDQYLHHIWMQLARLSTLLGDKKVPLEKEHSSKYLLFLSLRNENQEIFLPQHFEILNFILVCCHQNVPYRTVQFQIVNHFIDISYSLIMMSYRRKLFLFFWNHKYFMKKKLTVD